jgi:3-hydroxypropanoate dehydrogenase
MTAKIDSKALDQLFFNARTHNAWQAKDVPDALLKELVDLMKWAPTSANCSPLRIVFVKSAAARSNLAGMAMDSNQPKIRQAPVCAILGHDLDFHEHLPQLFPHTDARSWFAGNEALINTTAFRNGSLQGAYFILAARALGLDCGPMSGFDNAAVDREFFAGTKVKSNFLCNLGYGDPAGLFPRSPRFDFDQIAKIV